MKNNGELRRRFEIKHTRLKGEKKSEGNGRKMESREVTYITSV